MQNTNIAAHANALLNKTEAEMEAELTQMQRIQEMDAVQLALWLQHITVLLDCAAECAYEEHSTQGSAAVHYASSVVHAAAVALMK